MKKAATVVLAAATGLTGTVANRKKTAVIPLPVVIVLALAARKEAAAIGPADGVVSLDFLVFRKVASVPEASAPAPVVALARRKVEYPVAREDARRWTMTARAPKLVAAPVLAAIRQGQGAVIGLVPVDPAATVAAAIRT